MLDALEGAERAAKEAELTARRSAERTRQFVADAAHELRTPIAGLRAAAEAALSSRASVEERDRLHLLLIREAGRAGRLVEDLLALANIDAGLRLERQDVELRGLAEAEVERVRLLAPTLTVRVLGEPLTVRADPSRLAQVVANLLDNARRHTPDGGEVTVTVDRLPPAPAQGEAPSGAARGTARLRVSDTGSGVPRQHRERIFDRLVRLDDARSRDAGLAAGKSGQGGAGLGLAIARGIARAHGGELRCGANSVFELTLPLDPSGDGAQPADAAPTEPPPAEPAATRPDHGPEPPTTEADASIDSQPDDAEPDHAAVRQDLAERGAPAATTRTHPAPPGPHDRLAEHLPRRALESGRVAE
jgi:two-component system, OmpR family, sensor kinase